MKLDRCRIQTAAPSGTAEVRSLIGGSYGASDSVVKTLRSMKWNPAPPKTPTLRTESALRWAVPALAAPPMQEDLAQTIA